MKHNYSILALVMVLSMPAKAQTDKKVEWHATSHC